MKSLLKCAPHLLISIDKNKRIGKYLPPAGGTRSQGMGGEEREGGSIPAIQFKTHAVQQEAPSEITFHE